MFATAQEFKNAVAEYNGSSRHRGRYPTAIKVIAKKYIAAALQAGDSAESISNALGISSATVKQWSSSPSRNAPPKSVIKPSPSMAAVHVVSEPLQTKHHHYRVYAPAGMLIECDLVGVVQLIRALA